MQCCIAPVTWWVITFPMKWDTNKSLSKQFKSINLTHNVMTVNNHSIKDWSIFMNFIGVWKILSSSVQHEKFMSSILSDQHEKIVINLIITPKIKWRTQALQLWFHYYHNQRQTLGNWAQIKLWRLNTY